MSNLSLEDFFYVSIDSLCILDKKGIITSSSPSFSKLLGFTENELKGQNFELLIQEDDRIYSMNQIGQLARSRSVNFENRLITKNKTSKLILWSVTKAEAGDSFLLVGKDLTDERTVQMELRAQNRQLAEAKARNEATLGSIGDGVVVISDKGEVLFVNDSALSMLMGNKEEIVGKHLLSAILAVDQMKNPISLDKHPVQQALSTGKKVISREIYFLKKDETILPVALTTSPIFLQGVLIGGVLVFRDITKEKEVDRMKTEFISLASHQLRTPLSAMKWFSEMLLSGDSGEITAEQKEMVSNIYWSNERMIDLVNSLLNISRIESGRIIVDPRPTNLKKLIDEVLLELTPKINNKKHKIAVSVGADLPEINVDPKLIRHVYMNLMTNAIKYTHENGEIQILVSKVGEEIISQISDNGYGIPKEQQDKIFQKFFRADNVVKIETDGSGLGLYLTEAIVKSSGGKIWFESEANKGTTFWFSLPVSGSRAKEGEVTINS